MQQNALCADQPQKPPQTPRVSRTCALCRGSDLVFDHLTDMPRGGHVEPLSLHIKIRSEQWPRFDHSPNRPSKCTMQTEKCNSTWRAIWAVVGPLPTNLHFGIPRGLWNAVAPRRQIFPTHSGLKFSCSLWKNSWIEVLNFFMITWKGKYLFNPRS